jgi:hypothetical protein
VARAAEGAPKPLRAVAKLGHNAGVMNRLQRYRELMRTLDPSADPRAAVQLGWGVNRPASAAAEGIARRIELEPWSSHLIVGGIGSGKTTELWRIHHRLREIGAETGDLSVYVDVAAATSLEGWMRGTLVGLAGRFLIEQEENVRKARGGGPPTQVIEDAVGHVNELLGGSWIGSYLDAQSIDPGLLARDEDSEIDYVLDMVPSIQALRHAIVGDAAHCVLLFDSLDRMAGSKQLEDTLRDDIRVLKRAGIGVVVVGPMRLSYEPHPRLVDLFDQNVYPLVDVEPVGAGLDFLVEVLSRRVSAEIMPRDSCVTISKASGGVLRDLIALAKGSAQEAYSAGADTVSAAHIDRATDRFGRVRAVGLDDEQIQVLKKIRSAETLVIRGERELALLETRRVLDYGNGRFVVHPTLAPLLDLITVAA